MYNKLHVSYGNDKLGKRETMNVSLLPVVSCPQGVPCAKECYARKLMYSRTAEKAWLDNTAFAMNDPSGFMWELEKILSKRRPKFFRWHVAGDIPSDDYQLGMIKMAKSFPDTSFLVFTKWLRYQWPVPALENLRVFFSAWEGWEVLSKQWYLLKGFSGVSFVEGDEKAPEDAFRCSGLCTSCRACWKMTTTSLLLKKH